MNEPRPEVQWFAKQMELKLKTNDHKKHWSQLHQDYLIHRLFQEAQELWEAIENRNVENIIQEAADVANFAMMIADNAGIKVNGRSDPELAEIEDLNQLTMAIDDDVVILNPARVGD